ncbi:MAG TPA: hypothetical protein VFI16_08210, partial [Anaeromyxobacteraceae bacterium]|nr:hypothetical protein [Anaeromyxobacteraceae bacterium]
MRRGLGRAAAALAGAVSGLARALRPGLRPWERARRLGKEMLGLQRWSEAAEAWRAAVEARPERVAGHDGLAAALGALGRWDEAAVACRRAAELEPGSERSLRLGNALL